jgi:predicted nucleic acid-binding protein
MIVLFDTDVLLDVALKRQPHSRYSGAAIDLVDAGLIKGFLAWHSASNFFYVSRPKLGRGGVLDFLRHLMLFLEIVPVDSADLQYALRLGLKDFEDSMQVAATTACHAECIVTRNHRDYRDSPIPTIPPAELLVKLANERE